jgi:hypothetical protein
MSEQSLAIYKGGVPLPKPSYRWELAGTEKIRPLLAKLSMACRSGQADDLDRKAQAALYIESLSDLPLRFLSEAVTEWIKTQTFWPSVAELRAVAIKKRALCEADLIARQPPPPPPKIDRPTPAQMAEIKERIAKLWESKRKPSLSVVAK